MPDRSTLSRTWNTPKRVVVFSGVGSRRPGFFKPSRNAPLSPATVESNWAYFNVPTGTEWSAPLNTEVTFNGTDWRPGAGTPIGAKRWKARVLPSNEYDTTITYTFTLGGVNWPFAITTMPEPQVHFDDLTAEQFDALTEEQLNALAE